MKYMFSVFVAPMSTGETVTTTSDGINFVNFPAVVGNPNYDQFLVDAQLTDSEVQALTPDTWYNFPKETI